MSAELLFVIPMVLVPLLLVLRWYSGYRREEAAKAWAARIGWMYMGSDASLTQRWRGTPFNTGNARRTSEVVAGTYSGKAATSFAYRYTTKRGDDRQTYTFHVVTLALPAFLPDVQLTPDGFGAKLERVMGGQDMVFESEDFNRAWRVETSDPAVAHAVVHPRLMERLMQPDARGLHVRIEGTDILCWSGGNPDLDQVARRLGVLNAIVTSVPRHVWLDHGYDPART